MDTPQVGCKDWPHALQSSGYGVTRYNGKVVLAHRLAYCQHHGVTLESIDGLEVRHSCDRPCCVEPTHLATGTKLDNMRDMVSRGRSLQGERHPGCVLSEEDVATIKATYVPGHKLYGQTALAKAYGVTQSLLSHIINGNKRINK